MTPEDKAWLERFLELAEKSSYISWVDPKLAMFAARLALEQAKRIEELEAMQVAVNLLLAEYQEDSRARERERSAVSLRSRSRTTATPTRRGWAATRTRWSAACCAPSCRWSACR